MGGEVTTTGASGDSYGKTITTPPKVPLGYFGTFTESAFCGALTFAVEDEKQISKDSKIFLDNYLRYVVISPCKQKTPPHFPHPPRTQKTKRCILLDIIKSKGDFRMKQNNNRISQNSAPHKSFAQKINDFEIALASGGDYSAEINELATAIAKAVLNKCIDPQRTTATQRDSVSENGCNPALVEMKAGIDHDTHLVNRTRESANKATELRYTADGDWMPMIVDADADTAYNELIAETLTDGIDLVSEAIVAILEQVDYALDLEDARAYAEKGTPVNYCGWFEAPYEITRLSKRVYIKTTDSKQYREEITTPVQEVYRAVRRAIAKSRAVQIDPRNGYTYIEDIGGTDGLEDSYIRMGKWADIGGYDRNGNYTASITDAMTFESVLAKLNLTDRQASIIKLRLQGYGMRAIATYLKITPQAVNDVLRKMRNRCEAIGFTPEMWNEMTRGE